MVAQSTAGFDLMGLGFRVLLSHLSTTPFGVFQPWAGSWLHGIFGELRWPDRLSLCVSQG